MVVEIWQAAEVCFFVFVAPDCFLQTRITENSRHTAANAIPAALCKRKVFRIHPMCSQKFPTTAAVRHVRHMFDTPSSLQFISKVLDKTTVLAASTRSSLESAVHNSR